MAVIQEQLVALMSSDETSGEPQPTFLLFKYDSNDPLAVSAQKLGEQQSTLIARSTLMTGRFFDSGNGDIKVCPSEVVGLPAGLGTVIEFLAGPKRGIALVPTHELTNFLTRTQLLVPVGQERVDVDSAIESLLHLEE